jgi:hypothetical protein
MNEYAKKIMASIGVNSQDDIDKLLENYSGKNIIKKLE